MNSLGRHCGHWRSIRSGFCTCQLVSGPDFNGTFEVVMLWQFGRIVSGTVPEEVPDEGDDSRAEAPPILSA